MARFTWNSIQRKIQEADGMTPGLRAKVTEMATHMNVSGVPAPTIEIQPKACALLWSKGSNFVKIVVSPKGAPELSVSYQHKDLETVSSIVAALIAR